MKRIEKRLLTPLDGGIPGLYIQSMAINKTKRIATDGAALIHEADAETIANHDHFEDMIDDGFEFSADFAVNPQIGSPVAFAQFVHADGETYDITAFDLEIVGVEPVKFFKK